MKFLNFKIILILFCWPVFLNGQTIYNNWDDFEAAIKNAVAGDEIILAKGRYESQSVTLDSIIGTAESPIIIRAEEIGADTLDIGTYFDFRQCSYITIQGFVINISEKSTTFKLQASNHIRITQNIFNGEGEAYFKDDGVSRNSSVWISVQGKWDDDITMSHHNQIDHNLFLNKHTLGNMIKIDGTNELYVSQFDVIEYNHFLNMGPRAENEMEVIRVGWSAMSESDGFSQITNNLFEECNGDPEIISVKCNKNIISHNTFRRCQGTLSLRHGNESVVEGNFFFGEYAEGTGGVRIYGSDHVIINNYFEGLTGTRWDAPITLTEGDVEEGSGSLSSHFRIERAIIANNTLVNNYHGIEVGYNNNDKYSKPPRDVVCVYNAIIGDTNTFVKYINEPENMTWKNNIAYPVDDAKLSEGVALGAGEMDIENPNLGFVDSLGYFKATDTTPEITIAAEYVALVSRDIDGQFRQSPTNYGADEYMIGTRVYQPLTAANVGPSFGEYLYPTVSELSFLVSGGGKSVSVQSNLDWVVSASEDWIEVSPLLGSGYGSFTVTVFENTTGVIRLGTITLVSTNAEEGEEISVDILVSQVAIEPPVLELSASEINIDANAQSLTVEVISNVDFNVSADVDWISVNPVSGSNDASISLSFKANNSLSSREGIVSVSDGESLSEDIIVTQAGVVGTEIELTIVDAIASTEQTTEGNIADNVYDNDLTNRWSGDGDGAYITLDLGELCKVSFIKVGLFKGDERNTYFDIQTSTDGEEYFDGLMDITSDITSELLVPYNINDTIARYLRIVGHGNSTSTWNSFTEFEVWGWNLNNSNTMGTTDNNKYILYPNPNNNTLNVEFISGAQINIFDSQGKGVFSGKMQSDTQIFNLNLAAGIYYVKLQIGDKLVLRTLIIE